MNLISEYSERGYADRLLNMDQLTAGLALTATEIQSYRAGWMFADIEFRQNTSWPTVVRRNRLFREPAGVDIHRLADSEVAAQVRRQTIKAVTNAHININAIRIIPGFAQMSLYQQQMWLAQVRGFGRGFFYGLIGASAEDTKADVLFAYYRHIGRVEPNEDMTLSEYNRAKINQELRAEFGIKFISGFRDGQSTAHARTFGEEN